MGKLPSAETQLRTERSKMTVLRREFKLVCDERNMYRVRALKADQEVIEWKARFDALLEVNSKQQPAAVNQFGITLEDARKMRVFRLDPNNELHATNWKKEKRRYVSVMER